MPKCLNAEDSYSEEMHADANMLQIRKLYFLRISLLHFFLSEATLLITVYEKFRFIDFHGSLANLDL